jgi:hypothetical protein
VYSRKQKQIELHILPLIWQSLSTLKVNSSATATAHQATITSGTHMNQAIIRLIHTMYQQMGSNFLEKASSSSSVSARNLEILKDIVQHNDD